MGEVWTPRALPLHDGRLSLTEALGESGGPNPWTADASQIYVVRKLPVELGGEDALPEIYHLDASSPASFVLANDFQLQPRDVVDVAPAPVVRWNRDRKSVVKGKRSEGLVDPGGRRYTKK